MKFEEMEKNFRAHSPAPGPPAFQKKRGSFLNALGFFVFFFLLIMACVIATAYANRDRLLLEYLRQEGAAVLGVEVFALESILTRPVGQVSIEIKNLVFQSSKNAPTLRAEKVLLSTPRNLLGLYQLLFTHDQLALKAQFVGMHLHATTNPNAAKSEARTQETNASNFKIKGLPFPIDFVAEIRDSAIEVGSPLKPVKLQNITGLIHTEISGRPQSNTLLVKSSGQLALGIAFGERAQLPVRTDWAMVAEPNLNSPSNVAIDVTSMSVSTLGITLKSTGKLKWPEQQFSIEAAGSSADLGVLPVDKAESEALGLTGRLKGSAEVSVKASGSLAGLITAQGLIRIRGGHFPFDLTREKPTQLHVKGPAELDLEAPFRIAYDTASAKFNSIDLQLASFKLDLTGAEINSPGLIRKPAQTMFGVHGQITAQGETIELSQFELRFANLFASAKGQISIDPKRLSKFDFTLTLPSLKGWPNLLPILGTFDPQVASQAQGSFALKAQAEIPLGQLDTMKTNSHLTVENFEASGVQFPINYKAEKRIVDGTIRGSLNAAGSVSTATMSWSLKRALGSLDLKALEVKWDELFEKSPGQDVALDFLISAPGGSNVKASDLLLKIERFQLRALGSSVSINGSVVRDTLGDLTLENDLQGRAILSEIYGLVPMSRGIRAKFPSGTLVTSLHAAGVYKIKGGLENSPLSLSGRVALKSPRAVLLEIDTALPETEHTAVKREKTQAEMAMLHWPLIGKSKLVFDLQFESIAIKTSTLKHVALLANLQNGNLHGSMVMENAFSGKAAITSFAVPDLPRKSLADLKTTVTGNFQNLNLAQFAEFLSPDWKGVAGGLSSGIFTASGLPFHSTSLIDNAEASGTLTVQKGFLSTVSLDQLVNDKLTENPLVAKLVGGKPKVATKGVSLDMSTAYKFAKGRMNLKGFKASSPEKNELQLEGWLQKDLTAELHGFAFLTNTPIGGSLRQANSDGQGRLIVPVKISGSLKQPSLSIAGDAVAKMVKKAVALETGKLKATAKKEVEKVIEAKKQEATKGAVDAIKEELKKRGLGF